MNNTQQYTFSIDQISWHYHFVTSHGNIIKAEIKTGALFLSFPLLFREVGVYKRERLCDGDMIYILISRGAYDGHLKNMSRNTTKN